MREANFVKTVTLCEACRGRSDACVKVDREVPKPLGCTPGRPLGIESRLVTHSPRLTCPDCGRTWIHTPDSLVEAVNKAVARGGWGEFMRDGGVVVVCKAA